MIEMFEIGVSYGHGFMPFLQNVKNSAFESLMMRVFNTKFRLKHYRGQTIHLSKKEWKEDFSKTMCIIDEKVFKDILDVKSEMIYENEFNTNFMNDAEKLLNKIKKVLDMGCICKFYIR